MKCRIIDKTNLEAIIEIPDGSIIAVPLCSIEAHNIGDSIPIKAEFLSSFSRGINFNRNKNVDFF